MKTTFGWNSKSKLHFYFEKRSKLHNALWCFWAAGGPQQAHHVSLVTLTQPTPRHATVATEQCRLRILRPLSLASAPSAATESSPLSADSPVSPDAFPPEALSAPVAAPDAPTASSPAATTARNRCAQRRLLFVWLIIPRIPRGL
jgi:hypothetical protein